jgi:hypothetical protein
MRPKFAFALILSTALILGATLFLKQHLQNASAPSTKAEIKTDTQATVSNIVTSIAPAPTYVSHAPVATNLVTPEQHQAAVDAETDRLQEWSTSDDPASLPNILNDLTNADKEIRVAAIEAAKQFGSADAIPALKADAEATDDIQEKIDYLEAADFLSLPGISDSSVQLPLTPEQIQADQQKMIDRQKRHNQLDGQPAAQSLPPQNPPAAPNN